MKKSARIKALPTLKLKTKPVAGRTRPDAWLLELASDPTARERIKAALKLDDAVLDRVLTGRASLSPLQRRAIRRALSL